LSVTCTNKADHHDIAEILLKVALNTITLTLLRTTLYHQVLYLIFYFHISNVRCYLCLLLNYQIRAIGIWTLTQKIYHVLQQWCFPFIHTRSCLSRNSLSACTIFKTFKRMLETILPVSFMEWTLLSLSNIRIIPKVVFVIVLLWSCKVCSDDAERGDFRHRILWK
jgi:hypothetical protein